MIPMHATPLSPAARTENKSGRNKRWVRGCRFAASLLSSSYLIGDQIFLGGSLLTKDPPEFERPCTGALAWKLQRKEYLIPPLFIQYTGGTGEGEQTIWGAT